MTQHRFCLFCLAAVVALVLCSPAQAADPLTQPWPGSGSVTVVDAADPDQGDTSGLELEPNGSSRPGVMWAVNNDTKRLLRLLWDGNKWVRDSSNGWSVGKGLRYPGGVGAPDAEGVTLTDAGSAGGVFVSSESSSAADASRPGVLRYDVSPAGTTLTATREWNLTADLPSVGKNAGAESVEWIPDSYLVASGFIDQSTGALYDPAAHPNHGTGIFFVGLEANGHIYAYALDQTSSAYTRVAEIDSGFTTFGGLNFDTETDQLWVVCDNQCEGRSRVFEVDRGPGATQGTFVAVADYARPAEMPNINNEGFAIAPDSECRLGSRPVYWADDGNTDDHSLRAGTVPCSPPPMASAGWSSAAGVKGDFNGDGFGDLAVGVAEDGRGAVHVLPGSTVGVGTTGSQLWSQSSPGIADASEDGDDFGRALAVGDFNADGFADLAIGTPGEDAGAGSVHVLYGGAGGLSATGSQRWTRASSGVLGSPAPGEHFGATVAAGDLDGSAAGAELAIGTPGEDRSSVVDAGSVQVLRGSGSGLTGTGAQSWSQSSAGVVDGAERGDRFGSALAVGNLGGSSDDDLAIGVPEEDGTSTADSGAVHVLLGSATGVTATGSTQLSQNSPSVADSSEAQDVFGAALAIGDLDASGIGDLVVGVPGEDYLTTAEDAGLVHVLRGSAAGPTGSGSQAFTQATGGIEGSPEPGDELGYSVAVGDFGGAATADLAVGAPGEGSPAEPEHGVVQVIPGAAGVGLLNEDQLVSQDFSGITDGTEAGDRFGASLAAADYGGSTRDDLAIGVPAEGTPGRTATGLVHVLFGSPTYLTATGSKAFGQATSGVVDSPELFDFFGLALGR